MFGLPAAHVKSDGFRVSKVAPLPAEHLKSDEFGGHVKEEWGFPHHIIEWPTSKHTVEESKAKEVTNRTWGRSAPA